MPRFAWLGWVSCALLVGCAERGHPQLADGRLSVSQTIEFGSVAVHAGREVTVSLRNVGRGIVTVEEVSSIGPADTFVARFTHQGPHALITGSECEVAVRYTPRSGEEHNGYLIVHTDSRNEPEFKVEIHGRGIDAAAKLLTHALDFGRIEADAQKT